MRIDVQNAILLLLCLVLLLSVFSLSAVAAESDYSGWPINSGDSAFLPGTSNVIQAISAVDVYVCYVSENINNRIVYATYWFSDTPQTFLYKFNNSSTTYSSQFIYDSVLDVYIYRYGESTVSPSAYVYSSLQSAVSDLSASTPITSTSLQYSLPPGNAIYIQVPQGASYTLKTRMPESVLGTNHYPGNNQVITLVQSLPSGGSAPSSPLIPWQQDGALSVLGLSRNAIYQGTNASSGYLCIVNPLYYSGTANGPYEFLSNGSIDISVDSQTGFVVYPLDSSLGFTSGLGINVDTSILDNPYTGEIDPETGVIIWQDSNGGTSAPTTGGGNLVSTSETIFDFLRNIGDEISTFLKGPIQAIQVVVSAVRDFLSSFTQLYMWLPSPVYNLITSALMIALTIGVVKIFV